MKIDWQKINILKMITGLSIITSFILVVLVLSFRTVPAENKELFSHMIGLIEGAFIGNLCAYYFGSSKKEHDLVNDQRPEEPKP